MVLSNRESWETFDDCERQIAFALESPVGAARVAFAHEERRFEAHVATALHAYARDADVAPASAVLAAFAALTYRYCGHERVVIDAGTEGVRSPTPLRLNGGSCFDDVVTALDGRSSPMRAPGAPHVPISNVAFDVGREPASADDDRYELVVRCTIAAEHVRCVIAFDTVRFERDFITRLLGHFETLLDGALTSPGRTVAELPLLGPAERRQQLETWNDTATDFPDASLATLFEAQCRATPDRIAVRCGEAELTYARLDALANALAHALRDRGLHAEDRVGVCMERSIATIVATLGIVKAGAAYLPIDPDYPAARIRHMVRDAAASIVVVWSHAEALLAAIDAGVALVRVDLDGPGSSERCAVTATGDGLAYVTYTSGTTGSPKGVEIAHRGVARLVVNATYLAIEASDVVAQISHYSFDAFTFEMWGALLHGARLEIAGRDVLLSPETFAHWIRERHVGVMFLTSSIFRFMARERPQMFASMRCLMVGGEAVDPASVAAVLHAGPPQRLLNGYGPTEATTFAVTHEIMEARGARIPIGRPISNTQAYVLDDDMNMLPVGRRGQLFIGGPGLARGYLDDDASTAQKFVRHPFSTDTRARLYATGDYVRYLPSGALDFLGRRDRQQKVRGFRIETAEIEAAIRRQPGVADALVLVRADAGGESRIVAYVVGAEAPARTYADWRQRLASDLPAFALPNAVVHLAALPLTRNGKIDLAALADLEADDRESVAFASDNTLHYRLAAIWRKLPIQPPQAIDDDFFDAGGDSLLVARLLIAIEAELGTSIPAGRFLEKPTIAHLAELLVTDEVLGTAAVRELSGGGTLPPLFFMHGDLYGGGYYTQRLARLLPAELPFYVLPPQSRGAAASIKQMAREHVRALRAARADGPYYLGGYCSGGLVALEMARQLRAEGAHVPHVVLVDAESIDRSIHGIAGALDRVVATARIEASTAAPLYDALAHAYAAAAMLERAARFIRRSGVGALLRRITRGRGRATRAEGNEASVVWHWERLQERHVPQPYAGRITLLRSQEQALRVGAADVRRWRRVSRAIDVFTVPGDHLSCIMHEISGIAERLKKVLDFDCDPHDP